jgi:hypothetical protein
MVADGLTAVAERRDVRSAQRDSVSEVEGRSSAISHVPWAEYGRMCSAHRILLTADEDWEKVAVVHGEFFGEASPAKTVTAPTECVQCIAILGMWSWWKLEADAM